MDEIIISCSVSISDDDVIEFITSSLDIKYSVLNMGESSSL